MGAIMIRKCARCKQAIEINMDNLSNVIFFNQLYYHNDCFKSMALEKSESKRGKPQMWQDALDSIVDIEMQTKKMLEYNFARDELNDWILDNYNVVEVPKRLFQTVAELEMGKYKGKRCKPVKTSTICGCWKWGQRKLDEINKHNKSNGKGPTDDSARIMYDLAILVGKVPQFLSYKEKQIMATNETVRDSMHYDDVDMSKIAQSKQTARKDISDISDDIFTE